MTYSLSLDGGGSKLAALLFNEKGSLVSYATAEGINSRFIDRKLVILHIENCFQQLFAGFTIPRLERIICASVTEEWALYLNSLSTYTECGEWINLGEGGIGLLACGIYPSGTLALSGTGSDVFFIKDGQQQDMLGGHGALISDAGSGYSIGKSALEAALRAAEGWGSPTALIEEICQQMGIEEIHEAVAHIYQSPAPVRTIASLSRSVGQAVARHDQVAQDILKQAGTVLAEQVYAMFRRHPEATALPLAVIGGAFKTHALFFNTFCQRMDPYPVHRPLFEPVVGGVVYEAYLRHGELTTRALQSIKNEYAAFCTTQID